MALANNIFVDANVIVEILLNRLRRDRCIELLSDPKRNFLVSTLSVHLIYHFCEFDKVNYHLADEILHNIKILPIDHTTAALARKRYHGKEFEDCLQASCAELNKCNEILTLDGTLAKVTGTKLSVRVIR